MAEVERLALEHQPQLIVAGWSAYPRQLDFAEFRRIADSVGAYLMVDMAHFAGLVAAGLHPSPVPHAHVVTSTTHKTLGGPRGGIILATADLAKKFNSAVFPGQQGGPLEHVIAGKAVSFKLAAEPAFRERQERTLAGARLLADRLLADDARESGINVISGGTDVHLVLVDLRDSALDGKQAEDRLHSIGITVNRNAVPFDRSQLTFFVTSRAAGSGGGDIGGLEGADAHCQTLAKVVGSQRTFRAYLSAVNPSGDPIHARDRIGKGPWINANGALVANTLEELHGSPRPSQRAPLLFREWQAR